MNKGDLAAAVADKTGVSKAAGNAAVEAVFSAITDALRRGEEVRILGFGNFVLSDRPAAVGRHPQTGEPIQIDPSRLAKFRAGQGLKDALNR